MTLQQILELCLEANPNRGETFVRAYLQSALSELSQHNVFKQYFCIDTNKVLYKLPECVQSVISVEGFKRIGINENQKSTGKFVYYVDKVADGSYLKIGITSNGNILPSRLKTKIRAYVKLDIDEYDLCDELPLDKHIVMGIIERVQEFMHNDPQERSRSHAIWREALSSAVRIANTNADKGMLKTVVDII